MIRKWWKRRQWKARSFFIAGDFDEGKLSVRQGHCYKGIAIHQIGDADFWTITHLGTGHRLMGILGNIDIAKEIAEELADATDWRFTERPDPNSEVGKRLRFIRNEVMARWQDHIYVRQSPTPFCPMAAAAASAMNENPTNKA